MSTAILLVLLLALGSAAPVPGEYPFLLLDHDGPRADSACRSNGLDSESVEAGKLCHDSAATDEAADRLVEAFPAEMAAQSYYLTVSIFLNLLANYLPLSLPKSYF